MGGVHTIGLPCYFAEILNPVIPGLRWVELGVMDWVFAVSPFHPLAKAKEPLDRNTVSQHRSIVVADTSRRLDVRGYGVQGGQPTLAVPTMRAKIDAQRQGLGVGWLPRGRVAGLLERRELIAKEMADPREPNQLFVAWRGDHQGRALDWWLEQLKNSPLATRLVRGIEVGK